MKSKGKNKDALPTIKRGNQYHSDYSDSDIVNIADKILKYYDVNPDKYLLLSFFNENRDVKRRTVNYWIQNKRSEYLSDIYGLVKDICIERIIQKGIADNKAMALTIFLLKNINPDEFKDRYENSVKIIDMNKLKEEAEGFFE